MKIEVSTSVIVGERTHTEFHRKAVEHEHDANPKAIVVKVLFSEELAREVFNLDFDHKYMWWEKIEIPFCLKDDEPYFETTSVTVFPDGCNSIDSPGALSKSVYVPTKIRRTTKSAREYVDDLVKGRLVTVVDIDDFLRDVIRLREYFTREQELVAEKMREAEKEIARIREELNREYAENLREIREREEAEAAYNEEMRRWISDHGSEHLRKAFADGYKCNKLYLTERGAVELGEDYVLVGDANMEYWEVKIRERSCPSEDALDEVARVRGRVRGMIPNAVVRVVWLPGGQEIWGRNYIEEGCEAVRVERPDLRDAVYMRLM